MGYYCLRNTVGQMDSSTMTTLSIINQILPPQIAQNPAYLHVFFSVLQTFGQVEERILRSVSKLACLNEGRTALGKF